MSLAVETRKESPGVLYIFDGILRLAPKATIAVLGKGHVQVGLVKPARSFSLDTRAVG
jgi:hypothetical protein